MKGFAALLWGLGAFSLVGGSSFAAPLSQEQIYRLLIKVTRAPTEVSYSGTFTAVMNHSGRFGKVVVKVTHVPGTRDRVTVLEPRDLAGRVARRGDDAFRGNLGGPGGFRVLSPDFRKRLSEDLSLLLANYSLTADNGESVAGRATYRIDITPRFAGRAHKGIWVDKATGIVLKVTAYRPYDADSLEVHFDSIAQSPQVWSLPADSIPQSPALPPPPLVSALDGTESGGWLGIVRPAELDRIRALAGKEGFHLLSPQYLPRGFVLDEVDEVRVPHGQNRDAVHLLYSDGLSSISLFLEAPEPFWPDRIRHFFLGRPAGRKVHERGFAVVEGERNGTRFVLVSDIIEDDLAKMASSLEEVGR